ncbi:MAG TPA: TolC family protein, partial [Flavisolibacter sp.]|nr:TolC family protein [Flavisolibacter sp.]
MNRVLSFTFLFSFISVICQGQSNYTLQQCIDTALANNIPAKQKQLLSESAQVDLRQARSNQLPNVLADVYHGASQGKSIDPNSNTYVNQNLNYANYEVNSQITVFNGGNLQNAVKQYANAFEASKMEWQQAKDNLVLDVILAYLQVLTDEDLVLSANRQADVSQKQLDRLQILNNQGAIRPSDVSDLKGQLMNDQLTIVNYKNNLESDKLKLAQLMNKQYDPGMKLERIDAGEFMTPYPNTSGQVYETALQQFSLIKAVELRRKSFEYGVKSARGALFPTLAIGGGVNSNYSSTAQNATGKIPYNSQLVNNIATGVFVGLQIPIFNRFQLRNRVRYADINLKNSILVEQSAKIQLGQQIDQAYLNMSNAYEKYKVLLEQVNAYTESFRAAEVRYNAGVGNSVDYLTAYLQAKDRLDRANTNLISAKY